jgi:L-rhamnose mutarotase
MTLKPGMETEYERRHNHNPIWPELQSVLFKAGVRNYSIFLHIDKLQLFAYAKIEDEEQWNAIAQTSICREWWAHMAELMETNEDTSPQAADCTEVFHLTTVLLVPIEISNSKRYSYQNN